MALNSPELDIRLIVTERGDTEYRAKLVAKLLEISGRTDIPVGVGTSTFQEIPVISQRPWVEDYMLENYPGIVYRDGVNAIIDTIMRTSDFIVIISLGPVTNLAQALEIEPRISSKARFIGMQGSLFKGRYGEEKVIPTVNIIQDVAACQKVFEAPWDVTITPVDTCSLIRLKEEKFQAVAKSSTPIVKALLENYKIWHENTVWKHQNLDTDNESTVLFDTEAVYMAFSEELLDVKEYGLRVTDDGYTIIDENAKKIRCAIGWKDLDAYENLLVARITALS